MRLTAEGMKFQNDQNQTGSQMGLRNQVSAWSLLLEILLAAGWKGKSFKSTHPHRVVLLNGEKHSDSALSLNPAFTDWLMGWPVGWSDPLQPVTGWSRWQQRARMHT